MQNNPTQALSDHPLFEAMDRTTVESVAACMQEVNISAGDILIEEGEPLQGWFLVVQGHLVTKTNEREPRDHPKIHFRSGDGFGEIALLFPEEARWTIKAVQKTAVYHLPRPEFVQLLRQFPAAREQLNQSLWDMFGQSHSLNGESAGTIVGLYGARVHERTAFAAAMTQLLKDETGTETVLVDLSDRIPTKRESVEVKRSDSPRELLHQFRVETVDYPAFSIRLPDDTGLKLPRDLLEQLRKNYDYVMLNLPEDLEPPIRSMIAETDPFYLLTDGSPSDLYQAHLLMGELEKIRPDSTAPSLLYINSDEGQKRSTREIEEHLNFSVTEVLPSLTELERETIIHGEGRLDFDRVPSYRRSLRRLVREVAHVTVGLALGAGAARGLAHIGVLDVLARHNVEVDMVAGSSIGALIGAGWALGVPPDTMGDHAQKFVDQGGFFNFQDLSFPPTRSILNDRRITQFLGNVLRDARFSDTKIPLRIVASRINPPNHEVLSRGRLVDAVRASIGVPMVLEPWERGSASYVDGGVVEPVPVRTLRQLGADRIIAVNVIPPNEVRREVQPERHPPSERSEDWYAETLKRILPFGEGNIIDVGMKAMQTVRSEYAQTFTEQADLVIDPFVTEASWYDFEQMELFFEQGRRSARQYLGEIVSLTSKPNEN